MKRVTILIIIHSFFANFAFCQSTSSSEKDKINTVLTEFMQCIETKDSVKMYNLFHKGPVTWVGVYAEVTQIQRQKKDSSALNYKISDYKTWFRNITSKVEPRREDFTNIQIIEDGNIASVTFDYSFWVNEKKGNWGKEFWHLIKESGEWKIASVIFSMELEMYKPEFEITNNANVEASNLVRKMANELLNVAKLPGLSIAIRKKNEIIFAEGFGYSDTKRKIPITSNTQFRAASTSKAIAVTGLAVMMQEGVIDIDAEVQKYVPSYPFKEYPITLKQLAGNISGMPHYLGSDKLENRFYVSTKDALTVFSHHKLLFKPQTKYSYSSAGFVLLSAAMEGASGINFLDYLQDKVFNPMGMKSTEPDMGKYRVMPNLTNYYEKKSDNYVVIKNPRDVSSIWAAGGFVTTPTDLVNMTKAYANGYLTNNTVKKMFQSQTLLSGEKTNVGIGWRIGADMEERNVIEHAGVTEGTRSIISYFPDDDIAISVITNTDWVSSIEETAHMLALPFLKKIKNSSKLSGNYRIKAKIMQKGKETEIKGKLDFEKGIGKITLANDIVYALIHVSENIYSLISNQGIYYLNIEIKGNNIIGGRATMYKTPMLEKPINIKPFFTFTSE
ncbi:serine hydrolase [Pedobacter insulae]|uniref:CubicO group peptidase, beta-lactamase class C family n=1 Tax=Pedobacter insulae TaxID=414048 RepID=A0A1I2Y4M5_9SPHI|nr:serine hydrolase [Pedobacter insulae]SFH20605.1 CubicO group peptidase, beta-lactamase class C family [Pedobacter insulae]